MKTRTLLFFALLIMIPAISYGQIGRLIKNTVVKATTKEANREIDSAAQAKADKLAKENAAKAQNENSQKNQTGNQENQTGGQSSQGGGQGVNLGVLFSGKVDLKYSDEYSFTSRLYMQTETYDKKDVIKMDLYMYYSASSPSIGMETKSITDEKGNSTPVTSSMVMDGDNKCFIVLTDMGNTKMGIISPIPDENTVQTQPDGKPAQKNTPTNFTKTGNTRVVAGYKCDEYSYQNAEDKSTGKVWFTKDANLKIDKRGWQRTGMGTYYGYAGFEGGIILANEVYDDKGKLSMKSETKEINPSFSHSITVKGYALRQMNLNQAPKK
jgi:hypothetical protein